MKLYAKSLPILVLACGIGFDAHANACKTLIAEHLSAILNINSSTIFALPRCNPSAPVPDCLEKKLEEYARTTIDTQVPKCTTADIQQIIEQTGLKFSIDIGDKYTIEFILDASAIPSTSVEFGQCIATQLNMNRFEKDDVTITDACKNIQNYVQTTCSGGARVSIKCDLYCYAFGEPHKDYAECKIGFGNNSFDLKMYFTDVCDNERVNWTLFGLGREKKPAVFNCER